MERTQKYITGMILAATGIVFGGFFFLRGAVKTYHQMDPDISYSMPRPKSALYTWFFGLDGREIQYKEINPFKDKKAAAAIAGAKGSVRKDQKKAAKIDPKKAAAKNAKANTPIAAPKKPEVKVNIVNSPEGSSLKGSADSLGNESGTAGLKGATATAGEGARSPVKPNEEVLSPAQWRALVIGEPSKENVAKLVEAFNKKEVDANTLYLIMNDLLQSSNTATQSSGLLIAQSVPSLKSFTAVAENYEKMSADGKSAADAYFKTYMQKSRLSILAMALKSSETVVVHRAAQTMVTGLQDVKKGGSTLDPRAGRGVIVNEVPNAYSQFIPILQQLIQGSDSAVAGMAQSALTQIQGLSNA